MGDIRTSANTVYRDYVVDGVPESGEHEPANSEIRPLFGVVEDQLEIVHDAITSGLILEKTWAALAARPTGGLAAGDGAEIVGDSGTHTDPVASGVVSNSGRFRYSILPAGWERIGAAAGEDNRTATEAAAADAQSSVTAAEAATADAQAAATEAGAAATEAATSGVASGINTFGRAGLYGLTGFLPASVFTVAGSELAFTDGVYRDGLASGSSPTALGGWSFGRASKATAQDSAGTLMSFEPGAPRITDTGLTLEPQRTNLLLHSNGFDNAAWTKNHATLTPAATAGPDGLTSAFSYQGAGSGAPALMQFVTMTAEEYTFTIYAKANGAQRWLVVNFLTKGFDNYVWFDLENGETGQATGDSVATITGASNGFFRCRVTRPATAGSRLAAVGFSETEGVETSPEPGEGVYIAFAQIERGLDATGWIETVGLTAVRQADVAALDFAPATAGYLYTSFIAPVIHEVFQAAAAVAADVGAPVVIINGEVNTTNGVQTLSPGVTAEAGDLVQAVLTWDETGRRFYVNGAGSSDDNGIGGITRLLPGGDDGGLNSRMLALVIANGVALTEEEAIRMSGGADPIITELGPTEFEAPANATKAVTAAFGEEEKVYLGQQIEGDHRPGAGVVAAHGPDGELVEMTLYQYGGTIRQSGSQIFEFFIGADPLAVTDLSLRGRVANLGSKFNARNGADTYGGILAATGSDRVRLGSDGGAGVPEELLIQNGHPEGYFVFRTAVEVDGEGGTELARVSGDGFRLPHRDTAPEVAEGYTTLWARTDGTVQATANVGGVTTTVEL